MCGVFKGPLRPSSPDSLIRSLALRRRQHATAVCPQQDLAPSPGWTGVFCSGRKQPSSGCLDRKRNSSMNEDEHCAPQTASSEPDSHPLARHHRSTAPERSTLAWLPAYITNTLHAQEACCWLRLCCTTSTRQAASRSGLADAHHFSMLKRQGERSGQPARPPPARSFNR